MNRIVLWLMISMVCCSTNGRAASNGGQFGRIPSRIDSRFGPTSPPLWISASTVVDAQGKLIRESLPELSRMALDLQTSSSDYRVGRCITISRAEDRAGPMVKHSNLKDLAQNSLAIVYGTITDIDQGFSMDVPALLLEVQIEERLKDADKYKASDRMYVVYPKADFNVGGYHFCREDANWPEPPKVGDEVMLFPFRSPFDTAGQVFVPDPEGYEIILERSSSGGIAVPRRLRDDEDLIGVKDLKTVKKYTLEHLGKIPPPH